MHEGTLAKKAGDNLKRLIKANHITQEKMAELMMVDERTIRRWIKDGIDKLSTLEQIADIFNVDVIETFLID